MLLGNRSTIPIVPGVIPDEDSTELDTLYFTDSDRIRFQNGKLRQIGGWQRIFSTNFQTITGAARNIYSYYTSGNVPMVVIGTNTRLYAVSNSAIYNITPLSDTTIPIPNSLSTEYNAAAVVNVTTTVGSSVVTLAINHWLNNGDLIKIENVIGGPYNGIPAASFNDTFSCQVSNQSSIAINTGTLATSSGTIAITMDWITSYLYVDLTAHALPKGDRIWIQDSTAVGGIPDTSINIQNYITNIVDANTFTIQTDTFATSSVTAGGGAVTTIQKQIAAGNVDQSSGFGYGGGLYGEGLYGVPKAFIGFSYFANTPRIWSMETFGGDLILTPGDPATTSTDNIYIWKGDLAVAPTLLSAEGSAANVPLAARWLYVSNSIIVVLGKAGILNNFTSSGAASFDFTISAETVATTSPIEQSGPLISQASSRNRDLIFTENEVYLAQFVEAPFKWIITELFTTDGLIGPKARVEIQDSVFWMGQGDFYVFDGTTVNVLPNNTVKRYVYDNIDTSQSYKVFAYPNVSYQEISWFYCVKTGENPGTNEPSHYVTYNYKEQHWTIGRMSRTAAEEPTNIEETPLMVQTNIDTEDFLFQQEYGLNDYNPAFNPITDPYDSQYLPINAYATTNFAQIGEGDNTMLIYSVYPDSANASNLSLSVFGREYAQGPIIAARGNPYAITQATTKVDIMMIARERQYKIATNGLNSNFLIGKWIEETRESSPR